MALTEEQNNHFIKKEYKSYARLNEVSRPFTFFGYNLIAPKYNFNSFSDLPKNVANYFATYWNLMTLGLASNIVNNERSPVLFPFNYCLEGLAKLIYYVETFFDGLFKPAEPEIQQEFKI